MCGKTGRRERLNLILNGEILEEVDSFNYLGSIVCKNDGVVENVISRVNEGAKVGTPSDLSVDVLYIFRF